jgi:hypothetical protein
LTVILQPEKRWECPNCTLTDVTHEAKPHTRMHTCPGLKGLTAPMVPAGTRCKVEAKEREDYIGKGQVVTLDDDGKAIMAIETTREDGNDVAVLAPCVDIRMELGS